LLDDNAYLLQNSSKAISLAAWAIASLMTVSFATVDHIVGRRIVKSFVVFLNEVLQIIVNHFVETLLHFNKRAANIDGRQVKLQDEVLVVCARVLGSCQCKAGRIDR
jgi:hypothetical protein